MVNADTYPLLAPLKPAAEHGGKRLGGDSSADPSPGLLNPLLRGLFYYFIYAAHVDMLSRNLHPTCVPHSETSRGVRQVSSKK